MNNFYKNKVYLAISIPQFLKIIAILLQAFESNQVLLALIATLIMFIQYNSLRSLISKSSFMLNLFLFFYLLIAIALKVLVRMLFYEIRDVILIGVFL
jgi:hypothetical protein